MPTTRKDLINLATKLKKNLKNSYKVARANKVATITTTYK